MSDDTKQFLDAIQMAHTTTTKKIYWHGPVPKEIQEWKGSSLGNNFTIFGVQVYVKPKYEMGN